MYKFKDILLDYYESDFLIKNRFLGSIVKIDKQHLEFLYIPLQEQLILTNINNGIRTVFTTNEELLSDTEENTYKNIANFIKTCKVINSDVNYNSEIDMAERDYCKDGFMNVARSDIARFDNQGTSDNFVITVDNNGKYGVIMIDRGKTPLGWALAGGRVEVDETHEENAEKEVKEELGEKMKTLLLGARPIETFFETRGRVNTLLTIYYSENGYTDAIAGDDAKDTVFLNFAELEELLKEEEITIDNKKIRLIPHHYQVIARALETIKNKFPKYIN